MIPFDSILVYYVITPLRRAGNQDPRLSLLASQTRPDQTSSTCTLLYLCALPPSISINCSAVLTIYVLIIAMHSSSLPKYHKSLHCIISGIQFIDFTLLLLAILMPFPLPPAVIRGFNFESSRETRLCQ